MYVMNTPIGFEFKGDTMELTQIGYGVLPLFNAMGFLHHDAFQIPLITGAPSLGKY